MKIALFTDTYHPSVNGVTFVIDILCVNFIKLGHEVVIVAPKPGLGKNTRLPKIPNAKVVWLPAVDGFFYEARTSVFSPSGQLKKLENLNIDIVMFFTPGQIGLLGAYFAKHKNLPLVQQYSTDLFEYVKEYPNVISGVIALSLTAPLALRMNTAESVSFTKKMIKTRAGEKHTWRQDFVRRALNELHNRCDKIICVSEKSALKLRAEGVTANIDVVPNGVDALPSSPIKTQKVRERYGIKEGDIIILYVGRLAKEKNIDMLISAFFKIASTHPKAKLMLTGSLGHSASIKDRVNASKYAERVIFTGCFDRNDLGSVYASADIFAFPSLTDTQGLAINEAALAGLPIVWCDDGVNDIAQDGISGVLSMPKVVHLSRALDVLCADVGLRNKYGKNASKLAHAMSEHNQTLKLEKILLNELTKH